MTGVYIKLEPADFFMYRVIMIFDLENPDSEDQQVRDYLVEHELEPKYQRTGDYEGRHSELMQFGGCYLGRRHLDAIGQMQRAQVEKELVTEQIEAHLSDEAAEDLALTGEGLKAAVAELLPRFHEDSAFTTAESGELVATLDGEAVRNAARQLMAASAGD